MDKGLPEADVTVIRRLVDAWFRTLEKDPDAWLSLWTEDGVLMPPGMPRRVGRDQLREARKRIGFRKYPVSNVRVEGRSDLAVVTADLSIPRTAPEGGAGPGTIMFKLRKEPDGGWLVAAALSNFDVPAAL